MNFFVLAIMGSYIVKSIYIWAILIFAVFGATHPGLVNLGLLDICYEMCLAAVFDETRVKTMDILRAALIASAMYFDTVYQALILHSLNIILMGFI